MSFYKPRIGRTNPSDRPIHPGPGDHEASASSAHFPQPLGPSLSDATPAAARQADLVCLADIEPRPIDWLWTDRLAAGAVSVLSGDPRSGKTWVALAIALSRGQEPGALSASGHADPCTTLDASNANGAAKLLRPRFGAGLPLRKLAVAWLRDYPRAGQRSQYNVETAAQRDGICIRPLRRAKFDLGVVSTKESISGCWNWALPENEELANA